MSLIPHFHKQVAFAKIDPLGDGLGDEIDEERREDDSIDLTDQVDPDLGQHWTEIMKDVKKDPTWTDFSED